MQFFTLFLVVYFLMRLSLIFYSKVLSPLGLDLVYIATRFSSSHFKIFQKAIHQWIASILLHRLIYLWKEKNETLLNKNSKNSRWSYNFGQVKMTTFFSKLYFILIMWYSNLFLIYLEGAGQNLYLRRNYRRISLLQKKKQAENSYLVGGSYNFGQHCKYSIAFITPP